MGTFIFLYRLFRQLYEGLQRRWLLNRDPVQYARALGVQVGENCRLLGIDEVTFGSEPYLVKLGDHVTVTGGVRFITHDGGVWVFREAHPDIDCVAPIVVGNNVFLGMNVLILPGVTIGDNCVIGAGAVVTRSIPANTVAVGVPARPLKTVDEYWAQIQGKVSDIRMLNKAQKRALLEKLWMTPG
ncbi:MAG: acyltransferase [Caldilineaceae bacterium]